MNSSSQTQLSDWNNFVAASPFGDVLQCLEWGELKKPAWLPLSVPLDIKGERKAQALVLRRTIPRTNRTIFYVPRGPILDWSDAETAREMVTKLRALGKSHRAILIKIDPAIPSTAALEKLLPELGFRPSPDAANSFGGTQPIYNMKLDIRPPLEDVMQGFHQKWRYNIRLAERKGVTVKIDCTRDDLKTFHEIYLATAERDGFTGRPLPYFEKMWDTLVEAGLAKLFIAEYEGQALSAAICFMLGRQCWYVYGASSNEHRKVMPNHAMQWAMMNWAKERGCEVYDFRGVHDVKPEYSGQSLMESSDGLVRFKAGFNAELVRYIGEWDLPLNNHWYWLWTKMKKK